MPAAVIGGAIAAVGTVGGAALASKAQKKATNTATQAQLDVAAQNNALAREQYGQNAAVLAPFISRGNTAGSAANALLGLGAANNNAPAPSGVLSNNAGSAFVVNGGGVLSDQGGNWNGEPINAMTALGTNGYNPNDTFTQPATASADTDNVDQYRQAFDNYKNSTGYQFRMGEGVRALDTSAASRGVLQSGAAAKAALKFGQNIASDEFGNYINALFNQQGVGLSAAGAQAGVSSNYVNAATNSSNKAAGAISNAALLNGNAQSSMWGQIAGGVAGLGNVIGSSFDTGPAKTGIAAGARGVLSRWPAGYGN